jgi:hypothetical protein
MKEDKGESVFSDVNSVLSDKIVDHSEASAEATEPEPDETQDEMEFEPATSKGAGLFSMKNLKIAGFVILGIAGIVLIIYGISRCCKKRKCCCRR